MFGLFDSMEDLDCSISWKIQAIAWDLSAAGVIKPLLDMLVLLSLYIE